MNLIALYLLLLVTTVATPLLAQQTAGGEKARQEIYSLIDQYAQAREKQDTILLKKILTSDIDQLVSTGEWRSGIKESIGGMKRSSESNPGSRRLVVEKIRFLPSETCCHHDNSKTLFVQSESCANLLIYEWVGESVNLHISNPHIN